MKQSIVLVSGGMDSLVTAAIAKRDSDRVYFLHANYGQRTERKEKELFEKLCEHFQPGGAKSVDISYLADIGGSALTDPSIEVKDFSPGADGIPDTYVPFRNAHLVCIAVSWAEVIGVDSIYIGAVEEDSSGYPDCREEFYRNLGMAIESGTKDNTHIRIVTPVIHKTKSEIVRLGVELAVPFELSWSCYRDNDIACGTCDSCHLRLKAFREASMKDPIEYRKPSP